MTKSFKYTLIIIFSLVTGIVVWAYVEDQAASNRLSEQREVHLERAQESLDEMKRLDLKLKILNQEHAETNVEKERLEKIGRELGF